ncbi:hypothetical protein RRG08_005157 [Elysia crispata]|uniref:Uncharacterized protein n=1 Tax=Elysia crispata TaxID=231223 RepID=A0AAE0ZHC3_9GAST|nr:hypothetical protein RRG08_005157 [Elysia crispata]
MEQIAEFRRDGQIPVGDGTFLPITGVALPEEEVTNMPVTDGYVGNECVKVFRDTGCSLSKTSTSELHYPTQQMHPRDK